MYRYTTDGLQGKGQPYNGSCHATSMRDALAHANWHYLEEYGPVPEGLTWCITNERTGVTRHFTVRRAIKKWPLKKAEREERRRGLALGARIGANVRQARLRLKLSEQALAERVGNFMLPAFIKRLERGKTDAHKLSVSTLVHLAAALDLDVAALFKPERKLADRSKA